MMFGGRLVADGPADSDDTVRKAKRKREGRSFMGQRWSVNEPHSQSNGDFLRVSVTSREPFEIREHRGSPAGVA